MVSYVANAGYSAAPRYDARPVKQAGGSITGALLATPAAFLKNALQGAAAGLLTLQGTSQMIGAGAEANEPIATTTESGSIEAILAQLTLGGAPGLLVIGGAAALFLTAGRGTGRTLGLLAFVALAAAHANGMGGEDLATLINTLSAQVSAFAPLLQTAAL